MIMKMEELGFGNCTNTRACEAECPKNESIANIARLNREFIKLSLPTNFWQQIFKKGFLPF